MNVTCDQCKKRYLISDDKVAGKASVKIRCKQCQNLITAVVAAELSGKVTLAQPTHLTRSSMDSPTEEVPKKEAAEHQSDEQTLTETRQTSLGDSSAQSPASDDSEGGWFAMLKGKQQGPFSFSEVCRQIATGQVTGRTYLWKAGMADWRRAADLPEVNSIINGAPSQQPNPTRSSPSAVRRDVAVANEVPSPNLTKRPTAQSGTGAVVSHPLNDLFGDVGSSSDDMQGSAPKEKESPSDAQAPMDPFAALSQDDGKVAPPLGEATRFFIAQAGVNKRNPPWKIALFALAFVGGPLVLIYILNTFELVKLPTVTRTDEDGKEVQEDFFSAGGAAGLKDLLTGETKRRKAEAQKRQELAAIARQKAASLARDAGVEEVEVVKPRPQNPDLAAFYELEEKKGPKLPKLAGETTVAAVNQSGLSSETISKVVGGSKAFQTCVDNAVRKNPNISVGNFMVILNVGSSGVVKTAALEPKTHESSDWGQCMMYAGRRLVFPGSDGETQVELPFRLGAALMP